MSPSSRPLGMLFEQERPRRSARLQNSLEAYGEAYGFPGRFDDRPEPCGACLLEIDTAGPDGEFVALTNGCSARHCFHVGCIFTWSEQENTCPLCKQRFGAIGIYNVSGALNRVAKTVQRDQDFGASHESEEEDSVCEVCGKMTDEPAMLLCDGLGGHCTGACHFYCAGLESVPEGDWFCRSCAASMQLFSNQVLNESAGSNQPHRDTQDSTDIVNNEVNTHACDASEVTESLAPVGAPSVVIKREPVDDDAAAPPNFLQLAPSRVAPQPLEEHSGHLKLERESPERQTPKRPKRNKPAAPAAAEARPKTANPQ